MKTYSINVMRLFLLAFLAMISLFSFAQTNVSVLTQHNDLNRTGWNNKETVLNPANVTSGKFGCIGTFNVDDEVYAQPLIVNKISVGNHTGSVLYTATVNNTVYAFNANDPTDTAVLWKVSLNPTGQRAPNIFDLNDVQQGTPCQGNYRDFSGRFGIVGTPVIDTVSNTLYVATKTIDSSKNFYAYLNALDLKTGQHKPGSPHLITAQVTGTGSGSVSGQLSYLPKYQNQRSALLLYNNTVYVTSGSHCDWGPFHGWVLGFDPATLALKYSYCTTPDGSGGGIWMAGQGPSVGQDGNLYVVSGNGTTNPSNTAISGRSSSLVKLTPQLATLDWFTPANYAYLDQSDLDYGSDGVLIVPNSTTTISGSKEGISYVVDYNNMGRFSSTNNKVKDTLEFNPSRFGFVHVHGSPVYAQLGGAEFVYAWSESFNLRQFTFDRNSGTFILPYKQGARKLSNGMPGAMLSLSSNGADTSSAIVWACFPTSGNANNQVRPGTFAAYKANDVSTGELWNSDQNAADTVGKFAKFNTPVIANGKVYVPTFSKAVKIYGTKCPLANLQYGNGSGLKGEYFTNTLPAAGFPSSPTVVQTDPTINFNWGSGSPAPGVTADNFKIRWTGKLRPLTDDNYSIYVTASDGVRLWINDTLLIDSWTTKTATSNNYNIALLKSIDYAIKIEYYSGTNPASCILQWSANGICKQFIPATQLFPDSTCVSNGTGLQAEYFTNTKSTDSFPSAATLTRTEPTVNFNWKINSPAPGISADLFKVRFTGSVQSLDSGAYTFYVSSDDGFRLWVNNQLLIDRWVDQSASTEYSATVNLPKCTKNAIRLEYYENNGNASCVLKWSGPTTAKQVIPTTQLFIPTVPLPPDTTTCVNDGTGLQADYFTNTKSTDSFPSAATLTRTEPTVNFNWKINSPAPGISADLFKVRFTGSVQSPDAGAYTFYVSSDDGFRLWVNNQLLIDRWVDQSASTEYSATINLSKCTKNTIRLEYYENNGNASCVLKWSGPTTAKQVIPTTQLFIPTVQLPPPPPDTTTCVSNGTGLQAEYFTNTKSTDSFPSTATLIRPEPTVNFNWKINSPAPGISADLFKVRFTGFVQSPDAGTYTFYVSSDDGFRLWVNNQLLMDRWADQSASTEYTATINLSKCAKNAIRLEYYENTGNASCVLKWSGPTTAKQVIPATQLFLPGAQLVTPGTQLSIAPGNQIMNKDFVIYPNPNGTHSLTVSINADIQPGGQIMIYNMLGQIVSNNAISTAGKQNREVTIPIDLARGVYVIKLSAGNKTYSSKLVVL